jgi:uncharacterized membrane protein
MDDLFLLGRIVFGGFFVFNGANHFLMNATMVQFAAAKGVPMPEVAVAVAGVLILVGGFCVLTGFQPYVGLSCIALFLVCVTPMMHNLLPQQCGAARRELDDVCDTATLAVQPRAEAPRADLGVSSARRPTAPVGVRLPHLVHQPGNALRR